MRRGGYKRKRGRKIKRKGSREERVQKLIWGRGSYSFAPKETQVRSGQFADEAGHVKLLLTPRSKARAKSQHQRKSQNLSITLPEGVEHKNLLPFSEASELE